MSEKIGVIGAGAWGTAIAKVLAEQGHDVRLWCRETELAESIRTKRENSIFLPGVSLPEGLRAETDIFAAVDGRDVIVLAVPSPFLMGVVRGLLAAPSIMDGDALIVVVTKGFIPGPHGPRLILEALEERLPGRYRDQLVYLSGPSHAEEVSRGKITGLVAGSASGRNAIRVRSMFRGSRVLVYPSLDAAGVQVCAATKNVVAIGFGMLDAFASGHGGAEGVFGDNTESLLLAAGLNEMLLLGRALGATHPETFTSLAGVGDLDVTCRSIHGRNRRFGREIVEKGLLSRFSSIKDLVSRISEIGYLPEGAIAAGQVHTLAEQKRIDIPIMEGVYRILNRETEPLEFLESYLGSLGARIF